MKSLLAAAASLSFTFAAHAVPVNIVNHSFEDDPNTFNEFFFGAPNGWEIIDSGPILDGGLDVTGTLQPGLGGSTEYFGGNAPDGDKVALIFIGNDVGTSEVGLRQVLGDSLQADTAYTLTMDVGNIDSGFALNGSFFDLSGFPGFRIELLAGGVVLADLTEDITSSIPEGVFEERNVTFTAGAAHAQLGQALEIRMFNLNATDPAFPGVDLEVDFDDVRLDATRVAVSLPAPSSAALLALGALGMTWRKRQSS